MKGFDSKRKGAFLASLPTSSLEGDTCTLTQRCKFNFSYLDLNQSDRFCDWKNEQLVRLLEKLHHFSKEPLSYWRARPVGKSGTVLAIYGSFPEKSGFKPPSYVPHDVEWGRFRLEQDMRLAGFVIPDTLKGVVHRRTGLAFDLNTFYVVFLDEKHRFYSSDK